MTELTAKAMQEQMIEDGKRIIRESGQFRTVQDLADILRVDTHGLNQQLNAWKISGEIFSIPGEMEDALFPLFALTVYRGSPRVFEAVPKVLKIFGSDLSPWAIAGWFIGVCSYLDDQCPKDLVEQYPGWVIEAAQDAMDELLHR